MSLELTIVNVDTDFNNDYKTRTEFQRTYKLEILCSAETIAKDICCKFCRSEKRFDGICAELFDYVYFFHLEETTNSFPGLALIILTAAVITNKGRWPNAVTNSWPCSTADAGNCNHLNHDRSTLSNSTTRTSLLGLEIINPVDCLISLTWFITDLHNPGPEVHNLFFSI